MNFICPAEKVSKQLEALLQLKLNRILTEVVGKARWCILHFLNTLLQFTNFKQCLLHELCGSTHSYNDFLVWQFWGFNCGINEPLKSSGLWHSIVVCAVPDNFKALVRSQRYFRCFTTVFWFKFTVDSDLGAEQCFGISSTGREGKDSLWKSFQVSNLTGMNYTI